MTTAQQGGFECEFVEKPPNSFQSECPVCLQVLREPYQTICCGKSYCRVCIERLKTVSSICPCCKEAIKDFPNIGLQQSLYDFKVYCVNRNQGCQWTGELRQLDKHLNSSPETREILLEGCQFVIVQCLFCSEYLQRSVTKIEFHGRYKCPKRPFICEYCKNFESTYEDVTTNHWPVCGYYPVQCPNMCGFVVSRLNLEKHTTNACPEARIDCDFEYAGCPVKLLRKHLSEHLAKNITQHMSLLAVSNKMLLKMFKEENDRLKLDNSLLRQQVTKLTRDLQVSTPLCPVELTMTDFENHKKTLNDWYSSPFYTHPKGYKMCLRIIASGRGDGEGTHVSIYVLLLKGEFDGRLGWPFEGKITFQLLNQEDVGEDYESGTIDFSDLDAKRANRRVEKGERATCGGGFGRFISHTQLVPQYLKNDCLRVCVLYN